MFQPSETEKRILLRIARGAVSSFLSGEPFQPPPMAEGLLQERLAAFVSIHKGKTLRGCIGNLYTSRQLYLTVAETAISAATSDPRFAPLEYNELPKVTFEISILGPMEKVESVEEIEISQHGLVVTLGRARGLLLPQVAVEHSFDRLRFLEETCKKAGLQPGDWKSGATIHKFSASVFCETTSEADAHR